MIFKYSARILFLLCIAATASWGEETEEKLNLDTISIKSKTEKTFEAKEKQTNTETTVTREGLKRFGGDGQISSFKALDMSPSVNYQSADAYSLSNNKSIRVRGQSRINSTVEGISLQNYGLDPGVSDNYMFDMENLTGVTLYKGAVPAEKSLSPYNTGGSMERTILRPEEKFGVTLNESFGTFGFNKVFTRIDSGLLPTKTKAFLSYSHTTSGQWKGDGDNRVDILTFGLIQNLPSDTKVELYGTYSDIDIYNYRPLTYAQSKDLGTNYRLAYNSALTSNTTNNINYYDYNRINSGNYAFFANLETKAPGNGKISIKPYFAHEHGYNLTGTSKILGSAGVQLWDIVHDNYGVVAQYDAQLLGIDTTLGYWYAEQEPPGPPTAQRAYRATQNGLTYAGWSMLADPVGNHIWHSPYLSLGKQLGNLYVKAGVRYVNEQTPSLNVYNTTGLSDTSYPGVLSGATVNTDGSVRGNAMSEWLPNLGINYAISKELNTYFSYGRNFGRPGFDTWTTYSNNTAAFISKGLNAQYIWDKVKPEISDNFDLGMRYNGSKGYFAGTVFGAISRDKGVSVMDSNLGVKYSQNIAQALGYGLELEASLDLTDNLNLFANGAYNHYEFTDDIITTTNAITYSKGKMVPDTPEFTAKVGATYRIHDFYISPLMRFMGERYGDVENLEHVSPYVLFDLNIQYIKKNIWGFKTLTAGVNFQNIFDNHYIGMINTSDDSKQGSASYYAGAPFTAVATVGFKY